MIVSRERITLPEIVRGLLAHSRRDLLRLLEDVVPLDTRHCVLTNQGKSAFESIVVAAGLPRSRILLPSFFPDDFVGIFRKYEMTPVFVDVDPRTYQLDLGSITGSHLKGAKAVVLLHTFGLPADGGAVRSFADEHGLIMIEDCARALGASRAGELVGSFGDFALFSLPKCTPVREGGIALSRKPFHPHLLGPRIGPAGLLHALTLVRVPLLAPLEAPLYALLADTAGYPLEVGNYEPLPPRELDPVGAAVLAWFLPHYRAGLAKKRACSQVIRAELEPCGFVFQEDPGDHILTALSVTPPAGCDADALKSYLRENGVKASAMWRGALGISPLAQDLWKADPESTPVALELSRRLIQLPVNRFQTPPETRRIVELCRRFPGIQEECRGASEGRAAAAEDPPSYFE